MLRKKKDDSKVIKNWKELTIRDWLKFKEINSLQTVDGAEKDMMVGALVNGIPYEEFINLPLKRTKELMENTSWLYEQPKAERVRNSYTLNGRKYELIKSMDDITVAQYIDFQTLYKDGFDNRPVELLSVFLVPKGHQYNDGYDRSQVEEDVLSLPLVEGLGISNFFIRKFSRLIMSSAILLKWMTRLGTRKIKDKEQRKALQIQARVIADELKRLYGSIVSKR